MSVETTSAETAAGNTVYVYEAPVRLWHWVNALCITVLAVTGYFIASPLPTQPGEASANFLMGYIRFAHFAAAYIFAVGFLVRIYWALMGNHHARQLFCLPIFSGAWWSDLFHQFRWYTFIDKQPRKYVGHNPLAQLTMFLAITLGGVFMLITGFALYGEGAQAGSWSHTLFTSWVIPLFGQSQDVHTWHHLVAWGIVCFIILHVYAAIHEEIMSRQTMLSAIISGTRTFRE
ncbi:MAG: Ni/Fe-hydrogenase, b-type cytochrome subunit [Methylobacillus sp.]|jgi:Ni/Fe-hydrogenase 1 B-type cytochrome subunit|nr:Ni/Fe-hydrogenase, b-type cytochrome subunit [Methylobacillus sp.]